MEHVEEFISSWQSLAIGRAQLKLSTFENVVFRFVELSCKMSKNSKRSDYQTVLEYFRVHYYNEFMFKCGDRSSECNEFIDTLKEFSEKTKIQKKDYIELFEKLSSYYRSSMGGTKDGIPLLCLPEVSLRDAPQYYLDWCFDQVSAVRDEFGFVAGRCVFCNGRNVKNRCVGRLFCPAALLEVCENCVPKPDIVTRWLERCEAFMIPETSLALRTYIVEIFQVCSGLVRDPSATLKNIQLSLQEASGRLVVENKEIRAENASMRRKLADLQVVQQHIVEDNDELQLSIQNINEDRTSMGRRFRQCESAFYELRNQHENCARELKETKRALEESYQQQWHYYQGLKQHGLVA